MHFQLKPESEYTNQGYLYLMEKSKLLFLELLNSYFCESQTTTWVLILSYFFKNYFLQRPLRQHGRNIIARTRSRIRNSQCFNTINKFRDVL
jgi:hypothetical protein